MLAIPNVMLLRPVQEGIMYRLIVPAGCVVPTFKTSISSWDLKAVTMDYQITTYKSRVQFHLKSKVHFRTNYACCTSKLAVVICLLQILGTCKMVSH